MKDSRRRAILAVPAIVALLASLFVPLADAGAVGAPGDGDPTFAGSGITTFRPDRAFTDGTAGIVRARPSGGAYVESRGVDLVYRIAAYDADFTLDPTFSGDGILELGIAGFGAPAAFVVEGSGALLLVDNDYHLMRVNSDGTVDTGFNPGTPSMPLGGRSNDVTVAPNGTIYISGYRRVQVSSPPPPSLPSYNSAIALARLPVGGSWSVSTSSIGSASRVIALSDSSPVVLTSKGLWSGTGSTFTPLASDLTAVGLLVDPLDRIYVTGGNRSGGFGAARYIGTILDPSYSGDGVASIDVAPDFEVAYVSALDSVGRLVLAGALGQNTGTADPYAVVRLDANGEPDPTFGSGGVTITAVNGRVGPISAIPTGVVTRSDDGFTVVGGYTGSQLAMFADRYTATGSLDTTFATGGRLLAHQSTYDAGNPGQHDSSVGRDGAIAFSDSHGCCEEMGVGLLRPDGTPDTTFGGVGYALADIDGAAAQRVVHDDNGGVIGAGQVTDGSAAVIARFSPTGVLDPAFGNNGVIAVPFTSIYDLAIDGTGRLIVASSTNAGGTALARYSPNGVLDTTYGGDGSVELPFDQAHLVADGGGGVVVARINFDGPLALARVDAAGTVDPNFDASATYGNVIDLAVDGSGRILMVGIIEPDVSNRTLQVRLARLTPSGALDPTFGIGGTITDFGAPVPYEGIVVGVDAAGEARVAFGAGSPAALMVSYFDANGALDPGVGGTGVTTLAIPSASNFLTPPTEVSPSSLTVDSQNRVVVGGVSSAGTQWAYFGARLLGAAPTPPSVVSISPATQSVVEGDANQKPVVASINLDRASTSDVTVKVTTHAGTATAPADYADTVATVTIPAGSTTRSVALTQVAGDTIGEPDESFTVTLSDPAGATLGDSTATVTILNDDPGAAITRPVDAGGTVTSDAQGDGATSTDPVEVAVTSPVPGVVTVDDLGAPPPGVADYDFIGSRTQVSAPSATDVADPLRLVFTLDASVVGATPINDVVPFRNGVAVPDCASPAPAPMNATPWPCVYRRAVRPDGDLEITVLTLQASEWTTGVRKPPPALVINDVAVVEGDASTTTAARLRVTLSRATSVPVTVGYTTATGSAGVDDFRSASGTVVIPAGSTAATLDVAIVGDARNEANEVFTVNLRSPAGATIADGSGAVTIRNDDPGVGFKAPRLSAVCAASGERVWTVRNDNAYPLTVSYLVVAVSPTATYRGALVVEPGEASFRTPRTGTAQAATILVNGVPLSLAATCSR